MINSVVNLGLDAMSNLFLVKIDKNLSTFLPSPSNEDEGAEGVAEDDYGVTYRVQDISIPSTGVNTYEVHYLTQSYERPGGKVEMPREINMNIRMDRDWNIYKALLAWKEATHNQKTGAVADTLTDENSIRSDIYVWPCDATGTKIGATVGWTIYGAFVKNIGEISFDHSNGDPLVLPVTFGILYYEASIEVPETPVT